MIELGETKDALVEAAHKAGMADTATSVLHNVGNILNSVNASADILHETINHSVTKKIHRANELLKKNEKNLDEFITQDERGKKLLHYYIGIDEPLRSENAKLKDNIELLT